MMIWAIVKIVGVAFGAFAGFVAGMILSFYLYDHGDVDSAANSVFWGPIGVIVGSLLAYFVLRQIDRRGINDQRRI